MKVAWAFVCGTLTRGLGNHSVIKHFVKRMHGCIVFFLGGMLF